MQPRLIVLWFVAMLWVPHAARAQHGAIRVEATAPGQITVDDAELGATPVEVRGVSPGRHVVRIDFDMGGSLRKAVRVVEGQSTPVRFEPPPLFEVAAYRRGLHALLGVTPYGLLEANGAMGSGGYLSVGFNLGLTPRLDFRMVLLAGGGRYGATQGERERGIEIALRPSVHLNFGRTYSLDFGVRVSRLDTWFRGYACDVNRSDCEERSLLHFANLAVGPELSATSLRLGARREYEITLWGAVLFVPIGNTTVYAQAGISLTYLFLPAKGTAGTL